MIISFYLNGQPFEADILPHRRAVDLLREECGIKSVRYRCRDAACGACLILVADRPVHSCLLPAFELRLKDVWTMEGLSMLKGFEDIVAGFAAADARPCSYCAPARSLAVEALLRQTLRPTTEQIRETSAIVRCGCMPPSRMDNAVLRSARKREARIHAS